MLNIGNLHTQQNGMSKGHLGKIGQDCQFFVFLIKKKRKENTIRQQSCFTKQSWKQSKLTQKFAQGHPWPYTSPQL